MKYQSNINWSVDTSQSVVQQIGAGVPSVIYLKKYNALSSLIDQRIFFYLLCSNKFNFHNESW